MLYCPHQCRVNEVSGIKWLQWLTIHRHFQHQGCYPSPPHATAASDFSFQALSDIKSCSVTTSLHSEFVFPLNSIFVCQRYSNLSQSAEKKEWRGSKSLLEHKPKCEYRWIHNSKSSLHMTLCVYMYTTASTVSHHSYYIIRFYQSLWWQQRRPKGICSSNPTVISILKSLPLMTIYIRVCSNFLVCGPSFALLMSPD